MPCTHQHQLLPFTPITGVFQCLKCSIQTTLEALFFSSTGTWWEYGLLQAKDTDGTIAFTDILLNQLVELISLNDDDFSAGNIMTIETLLLTVFDMYWHSEEKMKDAVAELIGDKYAQCLNRLHLVGKNTIIIIYNYYIGTYSQEH